MATRYTLKPKTVEAVLWTGSDAVIKTLARWKSDGLRIEGREATWYGIPLRQGIVIYRDVCTHEVRIKDSDDFSLMFKRE